MYTTPQNTQTLESGTSWIIYRNVSGGPQRAVLHLRPTGRATLHAGAKTMSLVKDEHRAVHCQVGDGQQIRIRASHGKINVTAQVTVDI